MKGMTAAIFALLAGFYAGLFIPACVAQSIAAPTTAQDASSSGTAKRFIGSIKSISGNVIVLAPDSNSEVNVSLQGATRILRIAPGEKNLKNATPIHAADLQVGDRVLVGGAPLPDGSLSAYSVVVMKRADVESLHKNQEQDWQKRGLGGVVESVDSASGTVTISQTGFAGKKTIQVHTSKDTVIRRYAPDSVKFEDAKASSLAQIHAGDQLRARGDRNAEGTEISAEEIVSGAFRNLAGTVNSLDAGTSTLTVHDLVTKKNVEVHITSDSQLRQIPAEAAQRIAMRLKGATSAGPGAGMRANSAPGAGANAEGQPSAGDKAQAPSAMRTGARSSGPDFQQMLSRLPTLSLPELHKGDAILVLATEGSPGKAPTAITLLSGVDPILQAAPNGSHASILSPWNLGGAPGVDAMTQ